MPFSFQLHTYMHVNAKFLCDCPNGPVSNQNPSVRLPLWSKLSHFCQKIMKPWACQSNPENGCFWFRDGIFSFIKLLVAETCEIKYKFCYRNFEAGFYVLSFKPKKVCGFQTQNFLWVPNNPKFEKADFCLTLTCFYQFSSIKSLVLAY